MTATTAKRQRKLKFPVTTTRVHADVWSLARILSDGDTRRLRVESATAVVVLNTPRTP